VDGRSRLVLVLVVVCRLGPESEVEAEAETETLDVAFGPFPSVSSPFSPTDRR
jgi:hypothetical protein